MKARAVLFASVVCTAVVSAQSSSGDPSCPCISSFPAGISPGDGVTIGSGTYFYDNAYGLSTCEAHDANAAPYCNVINPPSWCADNWCYVDYATCSLPTSASSYFTDQGVTLHYSYSTCGATNTFASWFGENGLDTASGNQTLDGFINVIQTYLSSLVEVLENNEVEIRSGAGNDGTMCSGVSSGCPCVGCTTLNNWDNSSLNFASTSMTVRPGVDTTSADAVTERCMSGFLEHSFLHVAGKEAEVEKRVGFEYAAFNALGTYAQWPATDSCNWGSYDPRFRTWYVGAATGPKDVVIIIDKSGSMQQYSRMDNAKLAAIKVLNTLGDMDFVSVVAFSSDASAANVDGSYGGTRMVRATGSAVSDLTAWINALDAGGTTDYEKALNEALRVIEDTPSSTGCTKTILFLSDGEPNAGSWTTSLADSVQEKAAQQNARIFTYALGSASITAVLKDIACRNRGALWTIADGGDLNNAMAAYYTFLAPLYPPCKLRWSYYNDTITGRPLVASCIQAYKKTAATSATSCAGGLSSCVSELLGVVCMDVSLIVDKSMLLARGDSDEFFSRVDADRAACNVVELSEAQLQHMRAQIDPAFGDAVCPSPAPAADACDGALSPPPPPTPPPPTVSVSMAFVVAGTVDDFTSAVVDALKQKVADALGYPNTDRISLTIESASVLLTFEIETESPDDVITALEPHTATTDAAGSFLTTSQHSITVESIAATPSQLASGDDEGGMGGIIGGAVGGGIGGLCILWLLCMCCKKKSGGTPQGAGSTPPVVQGNSYYPDPKVPVGIPVA